MSKIRTEMGDERFEKLCNQIEKILDNGYTEEMQNRLLSRLLSRYGIGMAYGVRKVG